jgi:hypothetical protein
MNKSIRILALPLLAAAAFATGAAHAASASGADDYGMLDTGAAAHQGRTVTIGANTRWVNVTNGDTVRFKVGGKAFTYTFDTYDNVNELNLAKIAPAGIAVPNVRVYVAPNSNYVAD